MLHYDGVPVWHASVSLRSKKPVMQWSKAERADAERMLRRVLRGVGRDPTMTTGPERGDIALHWRRWITDEEALRVGPPRDVRGTDEELRRLEAVRRDLAANGIDYTPTREW